MKLTNQAQGVFAIAPTPFHEDGRIDEVSIERMADFYQSAGCTGITVLGIMGEALDDLRQLRVHLERREKGALGIILVRDRRTEKRQ